ncbi:MAG TPA: sulfate ABC transporter ATP-binding protein [Tepidisphaeraceae bacterium]|nr:sulfate ABC transporter ATP-binding protein [Tepidisphaeraceae bacterium]
MSIEVRNITKTFGKFTAVDDLTLKIETGELHALLGPSGSGKTTLLRIIAGLERADAGRVLFHDEAVDRQHVAHRRVGFVFQHYALFRHMNVFENVAFGLRSRPWRDRPSRSDIRERVMRLLEMVQLGNLARRYPSQLSGGQRQRVALARALAVEPRVLLLDEPFGALDAKVRRELRRWVRKLHDDVGITSVFVTHDQEEALELADRVSILNKGRIEQVGRPEEVYENPKNAFVLQFLGNVNLFHGRRLQYVRPHDLELSREPGAPDAIRAVVEHVTLAGGSVNVTLRRTDDETFIEAEIPRTQYQSLAIQRGEEVFVSVRAAHSFEAEYTI